MAQSWLLSAYQRSDRYFPSVVEQPAPGSHHHASDKGPSMRSAMLIMVAACWLYSIAVVLVRVRHIIREREQEAPWLAESAA
jgi:heme exporter protein C